MAIPDGYVAYVEIQGDWGRLAGGTRDEVADYWEHMKHQTGACKSRLVIGGAIVEERGIGSEALRLRIRERLVRRKEFDADADLIEQMAELLGLDVGEQDW